MSAISCPARCSTGRLHRPVGAAGRRISPVAGRRTALRERGAIAVRLFPTGGAPDPAGGTRTARRCAHPSDPSRHRPPARRPLLRRDNRSLANGEIVPSRPTHPKGRRRACGRILPLKAVEKLRPVRDEIVIATGSPADATRQLLSRVRNSSSRGSLSRAARHPLPRHVRGDAQRPGLRGHGHQCRRSVDDRMCGATRVFARNPIDALNGSAACHGRARKSAVATKGAGPFTGCVTGTIRPSTGTGGATTQSWAVGDEARSPCVNAWFGGVETKADLHRAGKSAIVAGVGLHTVGTLHHHFAAEHRRAAPDAAARTVRVRSSAGMVGCDAIRNETGGTDVRRNDDP